MDLMPSAEQEAVRDSIRSMLRDRMPPERVRAVMTSDAPVDRAFWRQAAELGWLGLALPEAAGGAGYGLPEAMLLFTELGRLSPEGAVDRRIARHRRAHALDRHAVAQHRADRVADGFLLGARHQVHRRLLSAAGRARARR